MSSRGGFCPACQREYLGHLGLSPDQPCHGGPQYLQLTRCRAGASFMSSPWFHSLAEKLKCGHSAGQVEWERARVVLTWTGGVACSPSSNHGLRGLVWCV